MIAKIIIIEDNQANLDLMTYLLGKAGYTTISAMDGEEGLQVVEREIPDLIICDIQIPKIDGLEVIATLKRNATLAHIPVIAITAYAMVGDKEKILSTGCEGYISKPIEPEKFVSQIESFILLEKRIQQISHPVENAASIQSVEKPAQDYRGTILIVDDNPSDLSLSVMLLQSLRFDSLSATNVNDAMQIISKQKPDLILADYHLPGMDGLEFNRMLKADENYKNIAFILISSSVPVADISKITESSAIDEFIHRPIEPHLFINIINKVWNRRYSQP